MAIFQSEQDSILAAVDRAQGRIEFTMDGTITHANANFLGLVGYTLDEVRGRPHAMFMPPEQRESPEYKDFWNALRRGEFQAREFRRIAKDGRSIWIQASYNPIFDRRGRPYKVVKFATDITAQAERNAGYEGQIAAINRSQAVIHFSLDGTITDANENFLNAMGADVKGAGTDVIKIRGVERLQGGSYSIIPDQIEAGTFMAAVAACGGSVLVKNVIPKHLECITAKLLEMGVDVEERDDAVLVRRHGKLTRTNVKTLPYPGFPTDMQPQIAAVLCLAEGTSVLTEGVWDNRYRYVDEFRRMGAQIQVDGKIAVIEGVEKLTGARIQACDLRAGAAMVIAGLAAQGTTEIGCIHHIERGYEDIVRKLSGVGADIRVVVTPDEEKQSQVG